MAFEKTTCLVGSQYRFDRVDERYENTVFNSEPWKVFASHDKEKSTKFLLKKLEDTRRTNVHTCPYMGTSNGELAVYALQQLHQISWFEFAEFKAYANKEITSGTDNHQAWLRAILADKKKRNQLKAQFLKRI